MSDVFAYLIPLPRNIDGLVCTKGDDIIIFIRESLCPERQQETLKHELNHINLGHLYDDIKMVGSCEAEA